MEFFFKNYFKKLPVVLKKLQCNGNRMTVGSDPDPNWIKFQEPDLNTV